MTLTQITEKGIKDGEIVNADINASAAITSSKLAKPIDFADNEKARFGTGNDLEIYHDSTNSYIDNSTGLLYLKNSATNGSQIQLLSGNSGVKIQALAGEQSIVAYGNGGVELYFDNVKKCETSANGLDLPDNSKLQLGDSQDLQFYHDGTNSFIKNNSGQLELSGPTNAATSISQLKLVDGEAVLRGKAGENSVRCLGDNRVELYFDNNKRFETSTSGISVLGEITQSGSGNTPASFTSTTSGANLDLSDNDTQSRIRTVDGNLHIYGDMQNAVADSAIKFFVDGSTSEKLRINGSGHVGIGTTNPDTTLHVFKGLGGNTTTSDTNSVLTLENSDHCILQMFSPATASNRIMFGDPADNNAGEINYDHSINALIIKVNGSESARIDSSGNFAVGTPNIYGKIHAKSAENTATFLAEGEVDNPSYPSYGFSGQNADNGSRGTGMYLPGDSTLGFATAGTEKLRLQNGGGISFNGDTAAANALDDYEEGTWTINPDNGTCTTFSGRYTKIGSTVTVWGRASAFSDTSTNALIKLQGLPFTATSSNFAAACGPAMVKYVGKDDPWSTFVEGAANQIRFYGSSTGNYSNLKYNDLNSGHEIYFSATYTTV